MDAYNELEIRMDQSLALDLDETSKCPIPKGKSSTPKIASSITSKTRLSAANQKPQQSQKAFCFTNSKDASILENSKRTLRSSTTKEKQQRCPAQIDTLPECGDVSRPPSKNQNRDRRLSKRIDRNAASHLRSKV